MFFSSIIETLIAYVHNVTPVKPAKRNPSMKYFNLKLQSPSKSYRSVCFYDDYHDKLEEFSKSKSPIKLSGIKRKMNFYNPSEEDIEISKKTVIEAVDDDEISFSYESDDVELVTIKHILEKSKDRDRVSLYAYLNIDNGMTVPTRLKKSGAVVNKKELQGNDNTGTIKVTLWGEKIKDVAVSGVYLLKNALVNDYNGLISLNTNHRTYIKESSDKPIMPAKNTLAELVTKQVYFPPSAVTQHEERLSCTRCNQFATKANKLFKCGRCGLVCLAESLSTHFMFKLQFNEITVTMNHRNLLDYFEFNGRTMPSELDDILISLLTDKQTSLCLDNRNNISVISR